MSWAGRLCTACEALDRPSQRRLFGALCSLIKSMFKVLRTQIAQRRVATDSIVIALDISKGFRSCLLDIGKRAVFEQLRFVSRKEALGVRIVVGLISAAHTLLKSVLIEQPSKLCVHVLPAAIRMYDQSCRKTLTEDRFDERLDDQFRRH